MEFASAIRVLLVRPEYCGVVMTNACCKAARSPRCGPIFRFWQCDKKNHGWCEGPPVAVSWQSFDLLAGHPPSRQNQLRTKNEYSSLAPAVRSSIGTWAGLKRLSVKLDRSGFSNALKDCAASA
jgi:hypothetical protein